MKVQVSTASGPVLDWMVAKCEEANVGEGYYTGIVLRDGEVKYAPSTDWAQGGPVIEREEIATQCCYTDGELTGWIADSRKLNDDEGMEQFGPTPLVAAMRCYVASKLGEEVEVPDALLS